MGRTDRDNQKGVGTIEPAAVAETTVEMWVLIDAKLQARQQKGIAPEIAAMILDKAMSLYITQIINEKKYGDKTPGTTPKDDNHCQKCGRAFTERERGFLTGKTGEDRVCYHCSH